MQYCDYTWNLHDWGIQLDEEIDAEKLSANHNWSEGDYFKLTTNGNRMVMIKVDPVEAFAKGYAVNKRIEGHIK
jgi:hypothetical protein